MKLNSLKALFKTLTLACGALLLAFSAQIFAAGVWNSSPTNPPTNNVAAPINRGSLKQTKLGPLSVNGAGASQFGLVNTNKASITTVVNDYARLVFDDLTTPTASSYTGVTFNKGGVTKGSLYRKDVTNEIQISNDTTPLISIDQTGKTTLNGKVKIVDGTQSNGYVLVSDGSGVTHWAPPIASSGASSILAFVSWERAAQTDWTTLQSYNIQPVAPVSWDYTLDPSPYNITVNFEKPLPDANYVVICNGLDFTYHGPMWISASSKTTTGFTVHGYVVSSNDETPVRIGALDCAVIGGGSNSPVYSNSLSTFTSYGSTYNPFVTSGTSVTSAVKKAAMNGYFSSTQKIYLTAGATYKVSFTYTPDVSTNAVTTVRYGNGYLTMADFGLRMTAAAGYNEQTFVVTGDPKSAANPYFFVEQTPSTAVANFSFTNVQLVRQN
jgi:hypothetical protein